MSILGCKVHHKIYGDGVIEKLLKNPTKVPTSDYEYISVRFSNTTANFLFPSAIRNNLLTSSDPRIKQYIEDTAGARTCSMCGKETDSVKRIEGVLICEDCRKENFRQCKLCKQLKAKRSFRFVYDENYETIEICQECKEDRTYECSGCYRIFVDSAPIHQVHKKMYCPDCFDGLPKKCYVCGEPLNYESGKIFYTTLTDASKRIYVCSNCIDEHTFVCSECGDRFMSSELVDSKYVPASQQVCRYCVSHCEWCNEAIDNKHKHTTDDYDSETYCLDCWGKYSLDCSICGKKFVPNSKRKDVCPSCGDRRAYVERLKTLDFSVRVGVQVDYDNLGHLDLCELFTSLHRSCYALFNIYALPQSKSPVHYIVMNFKGYRIVITFLQTEIKGNLPWIPSMTMTEFKKRDHREEVLSALRYWLPKSTETIILPEGEMTVLYSPVMLKVQTDDDKNYRKEFDGYGGYIQTGNNWGDTTDFYIIGVLK